MPEPEYSVQEYASATAQCHLVKNPGRKYFYKLPIYAIFKNLFLTKRPRNYHPSIV